MARSHGIRMVFPSSRGNPNMNGEHMSATSNSIQASCSCWSTIIYSIRHGLSNNQSSEIVSFY